MIRISTADPTKLLADIKAAIAAGTIRTWMVDSEEDLSHTDSQLSGKGFFFRPVEEVGSLRFKTLFTPMVTNKIERRFGYAYLYGHMTSMIIRIMLIA